MLNISLQNGHNIPYSREKEGGQKLFRGLYNADMRNLNEKGQKK
jgi:hypothetical protein